MALIHHDQLSFSSGEGLDGLDVRADAQLYYRSVKAATNFVVQPIGSISKRTGFEEIARAVFDDEEVWAVVPWVSSEELQYSIVATSKGLTVLTAEGDMAGFMPHVAANAFRTFWQRAQWTQFNDRMWLAHDEFPPLEMAARVVNGRVAFVLQPFTMRDYPDALGHPRNFIYHQGRLIVLGTRNAPMRMRASKAGDPNDFTTGADATDGYDRDIASGETEIINAVATSRNAILAFTNRSLYEIVGSTPTDLGVFKRSSAGAARVPVLSFDKDLLYVADNGRELHLLQFDDRLIQFRTFNLSNIAPDRIRNPRALARARNYVNTHDVILVIGDTIDALTIQTNTDDLVYGWTGWTNDLGITDAWTIHDRLYATNGSAVYRLSNGVYLEGFKQLDGPATEGKEHAVPNEDDDGYATYRSIPEAGQASATDAILFNRAMARVGSEVYLLDRQSRKVWKQPDSATTWAWTEVGRLPERFDDWDIFDFAVVQRGERGTEIVFIRNGHAFGFTADDPTTVQSLEYNLGDTDGSIAGDGAKMWFTRPDGTLASHAMTQTPVEEHGIIMDGSEVIGDRVALFFLGSDLYAVTTDRKLWHIDTTDATKSSSSAILGAGEPTAACDISGTTFMVAWSGGGTLRQYTTTNNVATRTIVNQTTVPSQLRGITRVADKLYSVEGDGGAQLWELSRTAPPAAVTTGLWTAGLLDVTTGITSIGTTLLISGTKGANGHIVRNGMIGSALSDSRKYHGLIAWVFNDGSLHLFALKASGDNGTTVDTIVEIANATGHAEQSVSFTLPRELWFEPGNTPAMSTSDDGVVMIANDNRTIWTVNPVTKRARVSDSLDIRMTGAYGYIAGDIMIAADNRVYDIVRKFNGPAVFKGGSIAALEGAPIVYEADHNVVATLETLPVPFLQRGQLMLGRLTGYKRLNITTGQANSFTVTLKAIEPRGFTIKAGPYTIEQAQGVPVGDTKLAFRIPLIGRGVDFIIEIKSDTGDPLEIRAIKHGASLQGA